MLALTEVNDVDLWKAHADELMRFATVLVGPNDAADVVADAFLGAVAAASEPTVANPRAYLYRAVANRAHDLKRSRFRQWRRDLAAIGPSSTSQNDDFSDVRKAVSTLSISQRSVVFLAYWEDLPERAIADYLGLSPGTVHRTLERARGTLRKALS